MEIDPLLLRERLEGFERYNAWERQAASTDLPDPATCFAWLEEAYELARISGALPPLPADLESWYKAVAGVQEMQRILAKVKALNG